MLEDVPADALLPIATPRLLLRPPVVGDLPALLDYLADPRVARYLTHAPWTHTTGRQALAAWIARVGLDAPARALAVVVEQDHELRCGKGRGRHVDSLAIVSQGNYVTRA